ncbi:MAG: hypothetical protein JWP00_3280 [Chloroflexi bacterium]|jgi:hypothetical protein|nr:hypothetical protein [Chloroflexota bacterium]
MLNPFSPLVLERILREENPAGPFPKASDRAAWQAIAQKNDPALVATIIGNAEKAAGLPLPALPATLFLEYNRIGEREGYETPLHLRRTRLTELLVAECLEGQGRFLDKILDLAWAICEESAWNYPAHISNLPDLTFPQPDLQTGITVLLLAEVDYLLGNQLDPRLGQRIRLEAETRAFQPYLTRHDHWWLFQLPGRAANWTGVCSGGIAAAAIYLVKDPARLAAILDLASRSLDGFMDSFGSDGGSSEGPGYWSFGFCYFTLLAHLVEQRTNGRLDFFRDARVEKAARFPLRTILSPQVYLNFSDCDRDVSLIGAHLAFLARRLNIPELRSLKPVDDAAWLQNNSGWGLRTVAWHENSESKKQPEISLPSHDWFGDLQWMIARQDPADPEGLVLAAKGGHNGEMHNQNDVGSFIVHYRRESLIAELGRGRYTRAYFGPERYDHFVTSSTGHSVPVVNGMPQKHGPQYRARLLEHTADAEKDLFAIDLKDAYPEEAGLESLERRLCLDRATGRVELLDEAVFSAGSGRLESALLTFGQVEIRPETVEIQGEKARLSVTYNPALIRARVEMVKDVDLASGPIDIRRLVFTPVQDGKTASIRLGIQPVN